MVAVYNEYTYRLEGSLAIDKVESTKDQLGLSLLVTLGPSLAQKIPFRLELVTDTTAESGFKSGQQDSNTIVARRSRQFGVFIVVELEGSTGRELLASVVVELVSRRFFGGQSCKGQQERRHGLEELHGESTIGQTKTDKQLRRVEVT